MTTPRVTIGVTTCNVERFLAGAFDSVLAQDFSDFEVVVCDNQSSDSTWDICQRYADKDSRFRIFRNPTNIGLAGNVRRVVTQARGEFIRFTAHDDLMAPSLLSACVAELDAHPEAVMAFPRTMMINDEGGNEYVYEDRDLPYPSAVRRISDLVRHWGLVNEYFGLWRLDALRQSRLHSANLPSSDRRMLVEMAARGSFRLVDEVLFFRRAGLTSSYGGDRGGAVYEWLEPDLAGKGAFPKRYAKLGGDFGALTTETVKALLAAPDLSLARRLTAATTFGTVFTARRVRTTLGRWRRRLVSR